MKSSLELRVTMVADEFIDRYMAAANGEYVKVYLYILRHQDREVSVVEMADALNHTESDVRRALSYWQRLGVLEDRQKEPEKHAGTGSTKESWRLGEKQETAAALESAGMQAAAFGERPVYTPEQVKALAEKSEFTQLLYIAQKFMNKVFTPRECEVFAYLYDGLSMSSELLEYLVEYCVQGGHKNIRYLETVALSWKEQGITTVEQARKLTEAFLSDTFGVMKAFGLQDRRPASTELDYIRRWFHDFSRELVLEACDRTIRAIQKPSFSYADTILKQWKTAGVRTLEEVRRLDEKRDSEREQQKGRLSSGPQPVVKPKPNQFHNFNQRDTDYDALVMERLKKRLGEG